MEFNENVTTFSVISCVVLLFFFCQIRCVHAAVCPKLYIYKSTLTTGIIFSGSKRKLFIEDFLLYFVSV